MENTASYTALRARYGQLEKRYKDLQKRFVTIKQQNDEMKQIIQPIKVSPDKLLVKAIQTEFQHFKEEHLKMKSRKREIVLCRQIFCHIMKKKTKLSWKNIGLFCGQDHSTAIHANNTINDLTDWDKELLAKVERIERLFTRYYGKG